MVARVRVRDLYRRESLRIRAVESIDVQRMCSKNGYRLIAQLEPVAVIVSGSDGEKAIDMAANEVDLAGLRALLCESS